MDEIRDRIHKRYNTVLRSIHSTESPEVLEMYLSAMTHSFDPHSSYLSPQSMEEFRIIMKLSLDGIGAALRSEDGQTIVVSIVKGGAAEKDGRLGVGDKITDFLASHDLITRADNVIPVLPPLITTSEDVDFIVEGIDRALSDFANNL